ncbi:GNAT family N-acetyltransferase [Allostreptomyces psammosilenae]|uniref:GNAT superfamily N-acetyltransferase n=1 Tax=Allostreptomyces psammosilenae TaxID=1892865 RepID=A0A852ZYL6_9ACTN|nr:GNAT family N-acetyltransferase [Allostreptomyces psammosilenae]NYI06320.1 GNAT superfamily N-acetyltransferase [Allostreptomyces psammosilenae]
MIRTATEADVPTIHAMIHELAEYEKAAHEVESTPEQLRAALFGEHPAAFAHIAEDDTTGEPVGFALWFRTYSTWTGTHGIHLEDLYVRPSARGAGHGRALIGELARLCRENGYARLEWAVLDWNEPAIAFYHGLGAVPIDEWRIFRLSGEALQGFGGAA